MRFIIRELAYEKPLAAGQLRYEIDGEAMGAVEKWRLTSAASGYRFLRVDLDAREAQSGCSYLYHLVLDENGRPERLSFRFWASDMDVKGNVLLEDEILTTSREVNGRRYEDEVTFQANCAFWFPSSIGLGLLANCAQGGRPPAEGPMMSVTLKPYGEDGRHDAQDAFALRRTQVNLTAGPEEQLEIMGRNQWVTPLDIRWDDQVRTIWLDEYNWPVKMKRGDGLTAVENRYVRYS